MNCNLIEVNNHWYHFHPWQRLLNLCNLWFIRGAEELSQPKPGQHRHTNSHFPLRLDTLLLLALVTAHMWFNPVSNALIVVAVAAYVLLDLAFPEPKGGTPSRQQRLLFLTRLLIVYFVVMMAAVLPTGLNVLQRRINGPASHAHDGLIQTEIAIDYLLSGKNPYTEDYVNTPMADFPGREPPLTEAPLYHNAYLPFLFVSAIPVYYLSQAALGWYDQRFVYLLAYFGVLLLLPQLVARPRDKLAVTIAFGLNFLFTFYLADGRNDVLILLGLVLSTVLLARRQVGASALVLGFTLATKHQAWFFLPFYLLYLLPRRPAVADVKRLARQTWPMGIAVIALILPFLLWDAAAFIDDTILYVSGSGPGSFPMKGWGFSTLLLAAGLIPTPESAFPFIIFELLFGLPVLLLMLGRQWRNNTIPNMWLGFAVFSFSFQFFSRFFNDNYFVFVLQLLVIAAFIEPITYFHEDNNEVQMSQMAGHGAKT